MYENAIVNNHAIFGSDSKNFEKNRKNFVK